jgi:hypothetical protein
MDYAIVRKASRVVKAIHVLAGGLLWRLVYILSEIELFSRVDFTASRYLKVCIRYLAISIAIETIKNLLKLFVCQK